MTKEKKQDSWTGVEEAITNASATIKTFVWSMVKGLGAFNAVMVKTLFSMDIITAIKQPIMNLTSSIATNMLGIAGTIGIAFVFVILGVKFIGQQRTVFWYFFNDDSYFYRSFRPKRCQHVQFFV